MFGSAMIHWRADSFPALFLHSVDKEITVQQGSCLRTPEQVSNITRLLSALAAEQLVEARDIIFNTSLSLGHDLRQSHFSLGPLRLDTSAVYRMIKSKGNTWDPYIQKADRYLSSWQANLLNTMGRTVLVNSVLDSLLVYFMSSLQLPSSVINQLDKKRRAFLWSGEKSGTAAPASCLVAWVNVCKTKEAGGLGIKDIGIQNICLLLKLLHRLHCPQSSAWAQWVHQNASVVTLTGQIFGNHWETLRSLLPLYRALTYVSLGNGEACSFWSDAWLGDEAFEDTYPALFSHCTKKNVSVKDMISEGVQNTMVPRLISQASAELQILVHKITDVNLNHEPDRRLSAFSKGDSGLASGAIYRMLVARGQPQSEAANFIWKNRAPPRVQLFMWLLSQKKIQSRSVLFKKHVVDNTICEVCLQHDETPEHIIWGCQLGNSTWIKLGIPQMIALEMQSLHTITPPVNFPREEFSAFIALVCWQLWKARNAKVFRNETMTVDQVILNNGDIDSAEIKDTLLIHGVLFSIWLDKAKANPL